jgi:putative nucleotide binding protein
MHPGHDRQGGGERDEPWVRETHCRVLSQGGSGAGGGILYCVGEVDLTLLKVRAQAGCGRLEVGGRLELPTEENEGEVSQILGVARYREMSNFAQSALIDVVKTIIGDLPKKYLSFYNRAGNLSLKFHAFQLLPGVGPSKATQMVKTRTRLGWETMAEVDEACKIDSTQLIAERLIEELIDPQITPSLLANVVRVPGV